LGKLKAGAYGLADGLFKKYLYPHELRYYVYFKHQQLKIRYPPLKNLCELDSLKLVKLDHPTT
jgi:hypothetical protein